MRNSNAGNKNAMKNGVGGTKSKARSFSSTWNKALTKNSKWPDKVRTVNSRVRS